MKRQRAVFLALGLALASFSGWSAGAVETNTGASAPAQVPATDPAAKISAPVRDVVKMAHAGVPDDVLKAFIENSSSTFNLTSENIIYLQEISISGPVTSAMLTHDKALRDKSIAVASAVQAPPANQQRQMGSPETAYPYMGNQPDYGYNASVPLNYYYSYPAFDDPWYYPGGYGWGWQPYVSYGFYGYPWRVVGFGFGHRWHHSNHGAFAASVRFNSGFNSFNRFGSSFQNSGFGVARSGGGGHFGGSFHR